MGLCTNRKTRFVIQQKGPVLRRACCDIITIDMSDHVTKTEFTSAIDAIHKRFDDLISVLQKQFGTIDDRFKSLDDRFDAVDARFDTIDQRLGGMDQQLGGMDGRINSNYQEIVRNGDTLAQLIQRMDCESAANQLRFGRIEKQLSL